MGLRLEIFASRILKSTNKKQLLSLVIVNRSILHKTNSLSFDVVEKIVQEVADVLSELIVKVSEISAVRCVISIGVIKSCHNLNELEFEILFVFRTVHHHRL